MVQNQNQGGQHDGHENEKAGQKGGGAQKPAQQTQQPGQNQQPGQGGEKKPGHGQHKGC